MPDRIERLPGPLAGRYRIERALGRGGVTRVYLAEDLKYTRLVAVKVLRPEIAALVDAQRFLREIEILARLSHPHILPLHDSGEAEGLIYFVMPWAEGATLRERLERERQLPFADTTSIAIDVARALECAHQHGVVHRDIKPDNILIVDGEAIVADFGIARAVWALGGRRITRTGISVGTPMYMSPEQVTGEGMDERSDIYALGCVMYEMIAGQPPFPGTNAATVVHQHVSAPVPDVRHVRPDAPAALQRVVECALAKKPDDRYPRASAFRDALEAVQREIGMGSETS